ncbi:MAG: outer membrane beta-barrel protein [Desulfobacteraceae bacterium]
MKKTAAWISVFSACLAYVLAGAGAAHSEVRYEVTPSISVSEEYDDNIYLDAENEQSDYMTNVTPSVKLDMVSERGNLAFKYAPTFVRYHKRSENNTVRHNASLEFNRALSERLDFSFTDTFLRSEDPLSELEMVDEVEGVRRTREPYYRNNARGGFTYRYGPSNTVTAGYGHSWLDNKDQSVDDSTVHTPFANLTHWFDIQNGMDLSYTYTKADFESDEPGRLPGDDYTGHSMGGGYTRRFTEHTSLRVGYSFTTRDFDGETSDYVVHEPSATLSHAFSEFTSGSLTVGYFFQDRDRGQDSSGPSFSGSITRRIERGSVSFSARGGWDEAYQEAERTGFSKYWGVNGDLSYALRERLTATAGASYRHDTQEEPGDRSWDTWRANCGLNWSFMRWFSLSLTYTHTERDHDIPTEDYKDNRVMLSISGSRLFRW